MYRFVQLLCQLFLAYFYIKNVYYDPVEIWDTSSHLVWLLNDWQNLKLLVKASGQIRLQDFSIQQSDIKISWTEFTSRNLFFASSNVTKFKHVLFITIAQTLFNEWKYFLHTIFYTRSIITIKHYSEVFYFPYWLSLKGSTFETRKMFFISLQKLY